MATVTIGADIFEVYGSAAGLATYAAGHIVHAAMYTAAVAADANTPKRAMASATRTLNAQRWQGTKTSSGQAIAWPRASVLDVDGAAVSDSTVPSSILDGFYELALALMNKPASGAATSTGSNVQSVGAGPASVAFFSPAAGARFPDLVMELVGWAFYGSAADDVVAAGGSYASGTDGVSEFDSCDSFELTGPA